MLQYWLYIFQLWGGDHLQDNRETAYDIDCWCYQMLCMNYLPTGAFQVRYMKIVIEEYGVAILLITLLNMYFVTLILLAEDPYFVL